ncbi:MAG: phage holin family protein [Betaproteobacteria bacterium]
MAMQSATDALADDAASTRSSETGGGSAWRTEAQTLFECLRALALDHLQLATLEATLAGKSLVAMIVAGVIIAVLLVSVWLGLVTIGILLLIGSGVVAAVAVLAAVGANLAIAMMLYVGIRRKSGDLRFPATLRSLRPLAAAQPANETRR